MAKSKKSIFRDVYSAAMQELGFRYHRSGLFYKFDDEQGWFLGLNLHVFSAGQDYDVILHALPYTVSWDDLELLASDAPAIFTLHNVIGNHRMERFPDQVSFGESLALFREHLYPRIQSVVTLRDALDFSLWLKTRRLTDLSHGLCGLYTLPEMYGYALLGDTERAAGLCGYYVQARRYSLGNIRKTNAYLMKYDSRSPQEAVAQEKQGQEELACAQAMHAALLAGQMSDVTEEAQTRADTMRAAVRRFAGQAPSR